MNRQLRTAGNILIITIIAMAFSSCFDRRAKELEKQEEETIQSYLQQSPYTFEQKTSGLYYYEHVTGTGQALQAHDTAYVMYSLKFLNGYQLATTIGTTDTLIFPVLEGWTIPGFDEGVSYMKQGGESVLLIPSKLAYGYAGSYTGTIPGYTPLLFDIFLVKVKADPTNE